MLNLIRNGEVEFWGAGPLPSFMAAQLTNTTLEILDREDPLDWPRRFAFGAADHRGERYVGEGRRSLRANIGAAAAADAFRLNPVGVNATTYLGATVPVVSLTPGMPYMFSFQTRCSQMDNVVTVRLIFRDAAGVVRMSLADAAGGWIAGGGGTVDLGTGLWWCTRGVSFVAPATDDAGNVIDNTIWQISNGTAGAQLLDLDDLRLHRSDDQAAE